MQNNYGWYGEVGYDYEPPEPPRNSVYDRITKSIYQKGKEAAKDWRTRQNPKNPYVRADFAEIWELGFFNGYENAPLG